MIKRNLHILGGQSINLEVKSESSAFGHRNSSRRQGLHEDWSTDGVSQPIFLGVCFSPHVAARNEWDGKPDFLRRVFLIRHLPLSFSPLYTSMNNLTASAILNDEICRRLTQFASIVGSFYGPLE